MINKEKITKSLASDGYVVIQSLIAENEIQIAKAMVRNLIRRFRAAEHSITSAGLSIGDLTRMHPECNPHINPAHWDFEPFIIGDLLSFEPGLSRLLSIKSIWQCVAVLLNCRENELAFHFGNVTRKPSNSGPGIKWHRDSDNTYFTSDDHYSLRVLIPLNAMSEINGGTAIFRKSHVESNCIFENLVYPTVNPGDCLIIHPRVLHGGLPNRSSQDRDVIVAQFGLRFSPPCNKATDHMSLSSQAQMRDLHERLQGSTTNT